MANLQESVKVDKLIRQVKGVKASSQTVQLGTSVTASASLSLDNNSSSVVTVTLAHAKGFRLFAIPQMTFYQDSVDAANIIYSDAFDSTKYTMYQWKDFDSTDNNNVVLRGFILNISGSTQSLVVRANWRFIIETVWEKELFMMTVQIQ